MGHNLKTFIAVKCPKCGGAAKEIIYGMVLNPPQGAILGGLANQHLFPGTWEVSSTTSRPPNM